MPLVPAKDVKVPDLISRDNARARKELDLIGSLIECEAEFGKRSCTWFIDKDIQNTVIYELKHQGYKVAKIHWDPGSWISYFFDSEYFVKISW